MDLSYVEGYFAMFRFQGWFFHDVTLGIVYGLTLLFGLLLFRKMFHRKKSKKKAYGFPKNQPENLFSFPSVISFFLTWLLFFLIVSHFGLLVFGGGISRNQITLDSRGGMTENQLLVNKWRRSLAKDDSLENPQFQLNALDLKTGKLRWNRRSQEAEKIIGLRPDLIILDTKTAEISLLNPLTGKEQLSFKEIEAAFPEMKGNWSRVEADYLVKDGVLYVASLDGRYYQVDFVKKRLLPAENFAETDLPELFKPEIDLEELAEKTGQSFYNGKWLVSQDQAYFFIHHSQTRESTSPGLLSGLSSNDQSLAWQINLKTTIENQEDSMNVWTLNNRSYFYTTNGFSFIINKRDGQLQLVFDQGYNRSAVFN